MAMRSDRETQLQATVNGLELQAALDKQERKALQDKLDVALKGTRKLRAQVADAEDERQQDFLLQVELSRLLADERLAGEKLAALNAKLINDNLQVARERDKLATSVFFLEGKVQSLRKDSQRQTSGRVEVIGARALADMLKKIDIAASYGAGRAAIEIMAAAPNTIFSLGPIQEVKVHRFEFATDGVEELMPSYGGNYRSEKQVTGIKLGQFLVVPDHIADRWNAR
jgi:hypothetical protein